MTCLSLIPAPQAPLPLTYIQALHRAADLKCKGWTWPMIARAMGEYHGHYLAAESWRGKVRYAGLDAPKRKMSPARQRALLQLHAYNGVRHDAIPARVAV